MATRNEKIADLKTRIAAYKQAEITVLTGGQSYEVEDKRFTRADLDDIRKAIADLESELQTLTNSSIIVQRLKLGRR